MENLRATNWLASRNHSIEDFTKQCLVVAVDDVRRDLVVTQSATQSVSQVEVVRV
jgi:hypothetical protein